ncbi:beta-1,3-glucosyltransferase [Plutella xylostella]|uniref:beta-1,3-glucosyltransferase n=1 Tax=Plutella xylostella TaxID=51655 RepID=UPI0020326985|nr:beta-1,3-glucosyltransferase [Plutella xylostella]
MIARALTTVVLLQVCLVIASTLDSTHVVFVIVSQAEPYHVSVASRLKEDIQKQIVELEGRLPTVYLTHTDFPVAGAWTVTPLLRPLLARCQPPVRWVVFLEAHTAVRCRELLALLGAADGQEGTQWLGYPLSDEEPSIVHHFAFYDELEEEGGFVYPLLASGVAMRLELVQRLHDQISSGQRQLEADFSIDPAFELAQLVYGSAEDPGPLLTADLRFCVVAADHCATYPRPHDICGRPVPESSIFFAVKTWSGFHGTRARVIKKTWGRHVTHLTFYSDQADPSLPSIDIGVPNTKRGHCAKTVAILKHAVAQAQQMKNIDWIFLADDDTILGVQRLTEVLSCYRGGDDVTLLGERYGYGYGKKQSVGKGYDYITGGGGTVFSVGAARALAQCACQAPDAPDDMTLGACAARRRVPVTHTPLMHQARPQDYPREVLGRERPISFHRHSSPEPLRVYATWFQHDDRRMKDTMRTEL